MNPLQRHTAKKVRIVDLLEGSFTQGDSNEPDYVLTTTNQKITRCKLLAIILVKEQVGSMTNILIEDGTGRITVRFFEESEVLHRLQIGDGLLIIGRVRRYNQEKYVSAEITKKVDSLWLRVQALELKKEGAPLNEKKNTERNEEKIKKDFREEHFVEKKFLSPTPPEFLFSQKQGKDNQGSTENPEKKNFEEIVVEEKSEFPFQKLAQLIKELDYGDGVLMENLLEKSSLEHTEHYVQQMLERGDIFQIRPGRIKVL